MRKATESEYRYINDDFYEDQYIIDISKEQFESMNKYFHKDYMGWKTVKDHDTWLEFLCKASSIYDIAEHEVDGFKIIDTHNHRHGSKYEISFTDYNKQEYIIEILFNDVYTEFSIEDIKKL